MEFRTFDTISTKDIGKTLDLRGKVETIKQTAGPTLMILNDGTGNFTFKAFIKPGIRAYSEIEVGDFVYVNATINERKDTIEGEVKSMKKLAPEDIEAFKNHIHEKNAAKVMPTNTSFSIKSQVLESQKDRFVKIATIIRKAVVDGRPILLRHNADCDGYSSAVTIERAILQFMDEVTGGDIIARYQNYRRAPSKAPFYEYEDAVKDLTTWLKDKIKNGAKEPLIIITDNGSTEEDLLSIKQMKIYNCEIVVVDHHFPGKVENNKVLVDEYIDAHINPYLTGYDSNVCAGMLGFELARFIYEKNSNSVFIPAMAAILDHTDGIEKEQYVEKALKLGFTEEYLATLGEIVDMQSHYIRFMEAREFIDDLFGNNMQMQKELVEMLGGDLKKRYKATESIARHYVEKEDFGPFYVINFDGERGTNRGEYPAIGKTTNHIHKIFEKELDKPIVTMTSGTTFLTIRISDGVKNISIPTFCSFAQKELAYTGAEGGGHERAGSVKFVEYGRADVIAAFKNYLREVAKKQ